MKSKVDFFSIGALLNVRNMKIVFEGFAGPLLPDSATKIRAP